ncbi:hypothetical protein [Flavisolibacter ginsenosidimutans]|uniref:Uncharacterized protein n=1 Tax=Flavisolibacter ginsenosidimutans TaxID=661481 RepID=A0A5B8UH24_9BACT|nr:hypothetical protein [Flavisolibacter ginsenosidimutans]QEC55636.1 hypothetical protein FSB75_06910 [Flavisolibacter ginsenosidimutans]
MTRTFICLFFVAFLLALKSYSQQKGSLETIIKKYFFAIPPDGHTSTWLQELTVNKDLIVVQPAKGDSALGILMRGFLQNWPVFEKTDSIKFYAGNSTYRYTRFFNGAVTSKDTQNFNFFREIFYFPLDRISRKQWKEIHTPIINDFKKILHVAYLSRFDSPTELVTFSKGYGLPTEDPMVSLEYGKIESRNIYFIDLDLHIKKKSGE